MGEYADVIARLPLYQELRVRSAGRDGASDSDVDTLCGIVTGVADAVGPHLDQIRTTFSQYTEHDLRHSANVLDLIRRFVPAATRERLNAIELTVLNLAALLHDIGMYVTDEEKPQALDSDSFRDFGNRYGDRLKAIEKSRAAKALVTKPARPVSCMPCERKTSRIVLIAVLIDGQFLG